MPDIEMIGGLMLQREHGLHESPCWYVELHNDHTNAERVALSAYESEACFFGRGAKSRARKALKEIAKMAEEIEGSADGA